MLVGIALERVEIVLRGSDGPSGLFTDEDERCLAGRDERAVGLESDLVADPQTRAVVRLERRGDPQQIIIASATLVTRLRLADRQRSSVSGLTTYRSVWM